MIETTFIYYRKLTFSDKNKFLMNFSNENSLEGAIFTKNKAYYITSMTTVDISKLPNYAKIEKPSDVAFVILRRSINFGYGKKELMLGKAS